MRNNLKICWVSNIAFSKHVRLMAPKINAGKSSDRNQVFGCPAHYNGHESTYMFVYFLGLEKESIELMNILSIIFEPNPRIFIKFGTTGSNQ